MAQLSFIEAATQAGVTRQTLYKMVSQGRLSATVGHNGKKQIEVTELLRVFGRLSSPEDKPDDTINKGRMSAAKPLTESVIHELERAKLQLQAKEMELALMRERVEELKAREKEAKAQAREATEQQNKLLAIVDRQTLLLASPKKAKQKATKK